MKKFLALSIVLICTSCLGQKTKSVEKVHKYTNALSNETSPYLLQHAHNPVDWKPWNKETLKLAKQQNKMLLISIGYAACHWCHVMEEESFEDEEVANLMNKHFICIKIDREELPSIDQTYMSAVQLLTGRGGWPLNCIALPDGRPIWGGTYFPKQQWMSSLNKVVQLYNTQPQKVEEFAQKLTEGVQSQNLISPSSEKAIFDKESLQQAVSVFKKNLDNTMGGRKGSPKFPMPVNLDFLLRYGYQNNDQEVLKYVNTTLTKMAYGGIYDQVRGGFSRYSTDEKWHIPHFEKMLYDNAQLVSVYAKAYRLTKNDLYKKVVVETLQFVDRELTDKTGAFYTSLDADSVNANGELEEGAYYSFTKNELEQLLGEDAEMFKSYFNVNSYGFWEQDRYVLIRSESHKEVANKHHLSEKKLQEIISSCQQKLCKAQQKRQRPRLDDKTLTSWNALMIKGYVDAYTTFQKEDFLEKALKNAHFILKNQLRGSGELYHNYKKGKSTINGFLEDYATVIEAFMALYEATFDEKWLEESKKLMEYTIEHFYNKSNGLFYFTHNKEKALVSRNVETYDNVIPSSNSIMARNLFKLGHHFYNKKYVEMSQKMLNTIKQKAIQYPSSYANWLQLWLSYSHPFYEVAIVGKEAKNKLFKLYKDYIPNKLIAVTTTMSKLPLLENRFVADKTLIYICVDGACQAPTENVKQALEELKK